MKIIPDFISSGDEDCLAWRIGNELASVSEKRREGRNRIVRFGWDYTDPSKWLRDIPTWVGAFSLPDHLQIPDSVTINEYLREQSIVAHKDSENFGDVQILSLLADVIMVFFSPTGEVKNFELPRRSLAIMSGELRHSWLHSTLPLDADRRISVVYRKKL